MIYKTDPYFSVSFLSTLILPSICISLSQDISNILWFVQPYLASECTNNINLTIYDSKTENLPFRYTINYCNIFLLHQNENLNPFYLPYKGICPVKGQLLLKESL